MIGCLLRSRDEAGIHTETEELCHGTIQLSHAHFQYMALSLSSLGDILWCSLQRKQLSTTPHWLVKGCSWCWLWSSPPQGKSHWTWHRWCSGALRRRWDLNRSGIVSELCPSWCWYLAISPGEGLLYLIFVAELGQIFLFWFSSLFNSIHVFCLPV